MAENKIAHLLVLWKSLVKLAPHMGHAAGHHNLGMAFGKAAIGGIGIGLQDSSKCLGQDILDALG